MKMYIDLQNYVIPYFANNYHTVDRIPFLQLNIDVELFHVKFVAFYTLSSRLCRAGLYKLN